MTQYSRTIGAQRTNAPPAWRTAMATPDRLYYISSNITGAAPALTLPADFGASASDSGDGLGTAGWDVISGYASGTLIERDGAHGTMVFGTGGHTRLQNQMLGIPLSDAAPAYYWWQLPLYKTSNTGGAELYYNPTEAATFAANRKIPADGNTSGWDGGFPVTFDGWIFPAKLVTGQMGDNVPHGFRFTSVAYVPASVTGTDPMMFCHIGAQGPFAQSWYPDTTSTQQAWANSSVLWTDNGGATYNRRFPFYFKNLRTGAWTLHQWRPDIVVGTFGGLICNVFRDLKKIYCVGMARPSGSGSSQFGYWSIDMSGGFGALSASAWVNPTAADGGSGFALGEYTCGAFTDGHPTGKHLIFTPDANNLDGLIMIDVDAGTKRRLSFAGRGFTLPANDDYIGMSYDATNNRILILLRSAGPSLSYYKIGIPSDPAVAAGYTIASQSVTEDVAGMLALPINTLAAFYGKTRLHTTLRCILVPTSRGKMLGFVPS